MKIHTTIKSIIKDISESKIFRMTVYIFAVLAIAIFIFQAGVVVGFHKASYGHDWTDQYSRTFGPGRRSRLPQTMPDMFPDAHGTSGKIIKAGANTIIVEDNDGTEKSVLITPKTDIRKLRDVIESEDLKVDDSVIVIGAPNTQGQIEARLIRVVPSSPAGTQIQ